jgi:CheY-like chemotaxis protein
MGSAIKAGFPIGPPWDSLPSSKEPPIANTNSRQTEQQALLWPHEQSMRILVVDDYADNVQSMAMLLRLYGHEVETALGGRAALRAARANPPNVVLLDISMPGVDGYEVARQLRTMFQSRVILIALTAHRFDEDKRRCLKAGFDRHFGKPADPVEVEQHLRELALSL